MKRTLTVMTLATLALLALTACGADVPTPADDGAGAGNGTLTAEHGTFAGRITVGPICPVEPCDLPEGAAYLGHDLTFIRSGGMFKVPLNTDGSFSIDLVPADYLIGMDGCNYAGCEVFPLEQTIVAGETVTFNHDFDTGIRSPFNNAGIGRLIAAITNQGQAVGMGNVLTQPFFEPQGRALLINGESIQVSPSQRSSCARPPRTSSHRMAGPWARPWSRGSRLPTSTSTTSARPRASSSSTSAATPSS